MVFQRPIRRASGMKILQWILRMTGIPAQREAENKWHHQHGEIPDGYCLVYRKGKCYLQWVAASERVEDVD